MKKLFAIILSFVLIIAPMPVAHAQGGGVASYAKQILGMANGIIGGAILTKCRMGSMQTSLYIYMAGSLVFLAGEILGGKKKQKAVDDQSQNLDALNANMAEGGDYQMAAIDAQITDEKSTLEFIEKRRKWMMATKLIYTAAMIMAILEIWWRLPPPAGISKPDNAACTGPYVPSEKFLTKAVIMAYSSLQSSGGQASLGGMAMGMGMQVAMKSFTGAIEPAATVASKITVPLLDTAVGRVAFFGASAILVFVIDAGLKKEQDASKKKIADLEKVKAEFKKNSANDNALAEGDSPEDAAAAAAAAKLKEAERAKYALKALPKGTELAKHCYSSGPGGAVDYSEAGCKNPIKLARPTFAGKFNIPSLTSTANSAADMANAVASGDLSRADIEAGNLATQAGRLDAVKNDMMKKLNDQLVKDGKKPIDINGELNRQVTELNKALNQANPGSGNYSLADVTGGEAGVSETSASKNLSDVTTAGTTAEIALPAAEEGPDLSGIGEGSSEATTETYPDGNVASLDESLNQFESTESDISNERDVSIFKQVSNRYFLNYTKIFQRKEINPPLAEPAPTP